MSAQLLLKAHQGLNQALRQLALGCGVKQTLDSLIQLAEEITPEVRVSVLSYDSESQTLSTLSAPSMPSEYNNAIDGVAVGPTVGSCGKAAFFKQEVFTSDIYDDPNWEAFLPLARMANIRACWSLPVVSSRGNLLGTFALYLDKPAQPSEFEQEFMTLMSSVAAVAIEKDEVEKELYYAATHDSLTGVANRHQFCARLDQLMAASHRTGAPLALYFIDINNFKRFNDNFGHAFGDRVLIKVAERLRSISRDMDVVGRLGGDEFVLLCPLQQDTCAEAIHSRLMNELQHQLSVEQVDVVASIGLALWEPAEAKSAEQLIADADRQMYQNKQSLKRAD
ncbi:sensor domain-containing diguanylate cyclase [Ferrimonas sp. YFM]|uniref:sensor domain-containing diguanylate cyclase n=1 Tax=Ferrimonas sp. YFM TaxID=3028878 RepID=UPI002572F432|nr:sensor domain-containing diguanylate cyclase [Ferrimonas sp. YFM]BDY05303.1 hypothetical protein F0521_23440 [Ferrimonas sp. YFM]